jgi:hypothetical protein
VEMVWFELAAPHAVLSNRVSATRLDRCDLAFAPRGVRIGTSARTCTNRWTVANEWAVAYRKYSRALRR